LGVIRRIWASWISQNVLNTGKALTFKVTKGTIQLAITCDIIHLLYFAQDLLSWRKNGKNYQ